MYRYHFAYEIYDRKGRLTDVGESLRTLPHRPTTTEDFEDVKQAILQNAAGVLAPGDTLQGTASRHPEDGTVLLRSVTLLATPDDQQDDDEWRRERAIAHAARGAAMAWARLDSSDRVFIGERVNAEVANALDALASAVSDARP